MQFRKNNLRSTNLNLAVFSTIHTFKSIFCNFSTLSVDFNYVLQHLGISKNGRNVSIYRKGKLDHTCSHRPFSLISVLHKEMVLPTSQLKIKNRIDHNEDGNMSFQINLTPSFSAITKLVHKAQIFSNILRFLNRHLTVPYDKSVESAQQALSGLS